MDYNKVKQVAKNLFDTKNRPVTCLDTQDFGLQNNWSCLKEYARVVYGEELLAKDDPNLKEAIQIRAKELNIEPFEIKETMTSAKGWNKVYQMGHDDISNYDEPDNMVTWDGYPI